MIVAGSPGRLLSPAEMEQQKELMDGPRSNHGIAKRRARSPPMEKGSAASAESKRQNPPVQYGEKQANKEQSGGKGLNTNNGLISNPSLLAFVSHAKK